MKTRNRKRTRTRKEQDIGSYESQTESQTDGSNVPWVKKKKSSRKQTKKIVARSTTSQQRDFVSSLENKESNLYKSVSNPKSALKQIVKGVVNRLRKSESRCLTELTNFLVQTSGSLKHLTLDDVMEGDKEELRDDLTNSYDVPKNEYPLGPAKGAKKKVVKKLTQRIKDFWQKLVAALGDSEELETVVSHCVEWLKELSKSGQEAFRYSSAANAYWIVDALVKVAVDTEEEMQKKTKQLESKKNKKTAVALSNDIGELEEAIGKLQELMNAAFNGVFVHRYRDTKPWIRVLSMESLGGWMANYSSFFVQNNFLRYMGWCLNDQVSTIRGTVLDSITELLGKGEDLVEIMQNFLLRFMKRFLEMVEDEDAGVVAKAVNLATVFVRYDLLNDDQGSTIPALLWDGDEEVSAAAAEFIHADTFDLEETDMKKDGQDEEDLKELVLLFGENFPQLNCDGIVASKAAAIDKMVAALQNDVPVLQNWKLLANSLLTSSSGKKKKKKRMHNEWNEEQLEILAYILLSAVRSACGEGFEFPSKKRDEDSNESNREAYTKILVKEIPSMLQTFEAEQAIILPLVQIPQYLDLDYFSSGKDKTFKAILATTKSVYLKHVDTQVHEEVMKSLAYLANDSHDLAEDAEHEITELATTLVRQLSELDLEGSEQDDSTIQSIKVGVNRLNTLLKLKDCSDLVDLEYKELQKRFLIDSEDPELGIALLDLDYIRFMWTFSKSGDKKMDKLDRTVESMYDNVGHVLSSKEVDEELKIRACQMVTSLFATSSTGMIPKPSTGLKENYREFLDSVLESSLESPEDLDFRVVENIGLLANGYDDFSDAVHTVFRYYLRLGKEFDELIKRAVANMRKHPDVSVVLRAQLGTLKEVFHIEKNNTNHDGEGDKKEEFNIGSRTKAVAGKFALMHGFSDKKRSFGGFLKEGVEYAFENGSTFLDSAVLPFASRSSEKDLRYMYAYLYREQRKLPLEGEEKKGVEAFTAKIKKMIFRKNKKQREKGAMRSPEFKSKKASGKSINEEEQEDDDNQEDEKSQSVEIDQREFDEDSQDDVEEIEMDQSSKRRTRRRSRKTPAKENPPPTKRSSKRRKK